MQFITYLILSLLSSITNILPLSYPSHIILFQNLFNTKIFNYPYLNSLFILSPFFAITLYLLKNYHHIPIKTFIKILILTTIINLLNIFITSKQILTIKKIPYLFLIISLLLLITSNKTNPKKLSNLTIKNYLFLIIFNLLSIINGLPLLLINLLACYIIKLNKNTSYKLSLFITLPSLFIHSFNSFNYLLTSTDLIYLLISLIIGIIVSLSLLKYLKRLIKNNQLYKISIYLIILSLFTMYWFR